MTALDRHRVIWNVAARLGSPSRALVLVAVEDLAQYGRPDPDADPVTEENPLEQGEVAAYTGLSLVGVENALRELADAGLVKRVWVLGFDEEHPDRAPRARVRYRHVDDVAVLGGAESSKGEAS